MKNNTLELDLYEITHKNRWGVIGASQDSQKYGYKILKHFLALGKEVVGVNPKEKEILGCPCVATIRELNPLPEVLCFVVPPTVSASIIHELEQYINEANVLVNKPVLWFQPGAYEESTLASAHLYGFQTVAGQCILLQA